MFFRSKVHLSPLGALQYEGLKAKLLENDLTLLGIKKVETDYGLAVEMHLDALPLETRNELEDIHDQYFGHHVYLDGEHCNFIKALYADMPWIHQKVSLI